MSITSSQEATNEIQKLVKQAEALIAEAEGIADKWEIPFSFSVAYGMGGTYRPAHIETQWEDSGCEWEVSSEVEVPGEWISSSANC